MGPWNVGSPQLALKGGTDESQAPEQVGRFPQSSGVFVYGGYDCSIVGEHPDNFASPLTSPDGCGDDNGD